MRQLIATLLSMLLTAGCATRPGSPAGADNGAADANAVSAGGGTAPADSARLPAPPPPMPQVPSAPEVVEAEELRALRLTRPASLHQQPAAGAARFGALKVGDIVLQLDARGNWYRIWVPSVSLSGWVSRGVVATARKETAGSLLPVPVAELSMVVAERPGTRLRSGPSLKSKIIRTLARGEALRLLGDRGKWVKVYDPETRRVGFIAEWLVKRAR